MSFVLTMGNSRIDRIKLLQKERNRNQNLRKTGTTINQIKPINQIKKNPKAQKMWGDAAARGVEYMACPYCSQQILKSTLNHHISFCQAAFTPNKQGNCTACALFRKK